MPWKESWRWDEQGRRHERGAAALSQHGPLRTPALRYYHLPDHSRRSRRSVLTVPYSMTATLSPLDAITFCRMIEAATCSNVRQVGQCTGWHTGWQGQCNGCVRMQRWCVPAAAQA